MKKIFSAFGIFLLLATLSCRKSPVEPKPAEATKFPVPNWKADETGRYPATMTAVFSLPATLAASSQENDKLAAFVNDECRGVGEIIQFNNQNLFFVLIQGLPDENTSITIKYYSSKTAYMYQSQAVLTFLADGNYGTAEESKIVALTQVK